MRECTCFMLLGIFAYIHCVAPDTPRVNDRSVKLALETVLEFSDKDKAGDITILDNVRNFITKVKTAIHKTNNDKNDARREIIAPTLATFTSFLQEVVKILNTYDNETFTDFFDILNEQMRKYHYRGCKFHELTDNSELKKVFTVNLDLIKRTPASIIKANLNTLSETLKFGKYDKSIKEIIDDINSLYSQDDGDKFQKVLSDLSAYGKMKSKQSDTSLSKIIKNGVRSIVFDHYSNLNTNVRRNFKRKIEIFLQPFNEHLRSKGAPNAKTSDNNVKEVKKFKPVSKKYFASKKSNAIILPNQEINEHRAKVKQSVHKNGGKKRVDVKHAKKQFTNTRINIARPVRVQDEKKIQIIPQHTGPTDPQRDKINSQEQSSYIDATSLEFYHEPKDNTRQNKMMNFEKISQKTNLRKKSEKIKTMRKSANNTNQNLWIEESTGRLPQAVLDKLAVKARRHESDYYNATEAGNKRVTKHSQKYEKKRKSWHGKIYERKQEKEYDKKQETKRMTKHRSKYDTLYEPDSRGPTLRQKSKKDKKLKPKNSPHFSEPSMLIHNKDLFKKNDDSTTKSVFNMERMEYKESVETTGEELNSRQTDGDSETGAQAPRNSGKIIKDGVNRLAVITRRAAPSRTRTPRGYDEVKRMKASQQSSAEFASQKEHYKSNKLLSRKSAKRFEVQHDTIPKDYLKTAGEDQAFNSLEKDLHVIQKIKNLEKEIEEVKNIMNGSKVNKENHELYGTRSETDINGLTNDSKRKQNKIEVAGIAGNTTEHIIEKENMPETTSKNHKIKDNKEETESKINSNADADIVKAREHTDTSQLTRDKLFNTTQKANNKKDLSIKSVKDKDFENTGKDKESETEFRSNDLKDGTEKVKATRAGDKKTDTNEKYNDFDVNDSDFKNNEIKDNFDADQSKNNVNADIVKTKKTINDFEMIRDRLLKKTKIINTNNEFLIKQAKDQDTKNIDKDKKTEKVFRSDGNLIANDLKDKTDNAKVTRITDDKNYMIDKEETKSRVNDNKQTVEPIQTLNYSKIKDNIERNKNKNTNINVNDTKTTQVKLKDSPKEMEEKLKQSGAKSRLDSNRNTSSSDDHQNRLIEAAKMKLIQPVVGKRSKTKVHNINKHIEPEASFRSDGDKVLNEVQNTTNKANTTEKDIKEPNKTSKKILKEDENTESINKMMRVHAPEQTNTGSKQTVSTASVSTPRKSSVLTTKVTSVVSTSLDTLKPSTISVGVLGATSSKLPSLPVDRSIDTQL